MGNLLSGDENETNENGTSATDAPATANQPAASESAQSPPITPAREISAKHKPRRHAVNGKAREIEAVPQIALNIADLTSSPSANVHVLQVRVPSSSGAFFHFQLRCFCFTVFSLQFVCLLKR